MKAVFIFILAMLSSTFASSQNFKLNSIDDLNKERFQKLTQSKWESQATTLNTKQTSNFKSATISDASSQQIESETFRNWDSTDQLFKNFSKRIYNYTSNEIVSDIKNYVWDMNTYKLSDKESYTFDSNGNLTENISYQILEDIEIPYIKCNFNYDGFNNRVSQTIYTYDITTESWTPLSETSLSYNTDNLVSEIRNNLYDTLHQDWVPSSKSLYSYTSDFNLDEIIVFNYNDITLEYYLATKYSFTWSGTDKTSSNTYIWSGAEWVNFNKSLYNYTSTTNTITNMSWDSAANSWKNTTRELYTYIDDKLNTLYFQNFDSYFTTWKPGAKLCYDLSQPNLIYSCYLEYNNTASDYVNVNDNTITLRDDISTNIEEVEQQTIAIYPNPSQENIYLLNNDNVSKVEIYTLTGSHVKTSENIQEGISIIDLTNGSYWLVGFDCKNQKICKSSFIKN